LRKQTSFAFFNIHFAMQIGLDRRFRTIFLQYVFLMMFIHKSHSVEK